MLYISDVNFNEALFHSQVKPHVEELRKHIDVDLCVLSRGGESEGAFCFPSVSGDYVYSISKFNFFLNLRSVRAFLSNKNINVIYSRGTRGGLLGLFIKRYILKYPLVFLNDVRADVLDEHKSNYFIQSAFKRSNSKIFNESSVVFFVSSYLLSKYRAFFNIATESLFVFPTFVPSGKFDFSISNRAQLRLSLGLNDRDVVVLYSGNLAKWQNFDFIIDTFSTVENESLFLLVLTKDPRISGYIERYQLNSNKRVFIYEADYSEIERYYHAADYGLLIRDNSDTNRCSSPTKFSEYVNAGLQLIINEIESDYVQQYKDLKLTGVLMKDKRELFQVFSSLEFNKAKARNSISVNTLTDIVESQVSILKSVT